MGLFWATYRSATDIPRQLRHNRRRYGRYQHNIHDPATRFLIGLGSIVVALIGAPAAAGITGSLGGNHAAATITALLTLGAAIAMAYIAIKGAPKPRPTNEPPTGPSPKPPPDDGPPNPRMYHSNRR